MTFTATPATPFTAGVSTIPATTANTWRANIAASLDTVGGGAYANVSVIDWSAGSAGWRFYAPLTVKSTGTLTLDAGATVTINADPSLFGTMRVGIGGAGGAVRFYATSTLTVDDTVAVSCAGDVTMTGASTLTHAALSAETHASTSSDTYSAGSVLAINTASATMGSDSVLTVNGTAGHVAQVICDTYSTTTFRTGAGVTCNSGSIFTIGAGCIANATFGASSTLTIASSGNVSLASGSTTTLVSGCIFTGTIGGGGAVSTLTFGADANLVFGNSSDIAHNSGSLDTYANLSTLTLAAGSTLNQGGDTTRTGKTVRSGVDAWEGLRFANGNLTDDTIDAREVDFLSVTNPAVDIVYTLTNLTGNPAVMFTIRALLAANTLTVKNGGGTTLYTFNDLGNARSVVFIWTGTLWIVGPVGQAI